MKRPNLHLIGVPECDGENESKLENTLQDIIQENFSNLGRQANIQIEEIQRTSQRYSSRTATPGPGAVAQACNPSSVGDRGRWITSSRDQDHPGQHGETPSLLKIQKISWAWWRVPVVPATREAEAGKLPEPRRRRLR